MFGFHHDTRELLGPGIAKNDAAIFAKSGLRLGERAGNFREGIERRFRAHLHVDDLLRVILQALDQRLDFSVQGD